MKSLLTLIALLLSTTLFASTDWCSSVEVTYAPYHGVAMQMTIKDPEVINLFRNKFPYDDCYQGVCSYFQDRETGFLKINFTKKMTNGYWGKGTAYEYTTFGTDNGTWIAFKGDREEESWLWRGCY